jgi:hypothetical protein
MIRALSAQEIVHIWEVGQGQHPLDRALTMLLAVLPEMSRNALALLSIGQRDSCLLALREQTFGPRLASVATCPTCQEQVEFVLDAREMEINPDMRPAGAAQSISVEGLTIQFRPPNSLDLAAIAGNNEISFARETLIRRCIVQVLRNNHAVTDAGEVLAATVVATVAASMEMCDPLAEIWVDLDCPACQSHWQLLFDIVSFFWAEIVAQAKRLLREVHTLARTYGWREADILSMGSIRRQFYLEMVT